jgi:hypothetical protein
MEMDEHDKADRIDLILARQRGWSAKLIKFTKKPFVVNFVLLIVAVVVAYGVQFQDLCWKYAVVATTGVRPFLYCVAFAWNFSLWARANGLSAFRSRGLKGLRAEFHRSFWNDPPIS